MRKNRWLILAMLIFLPAFSIGCGGGGDSDDDGSGGGGCDNCSANFSPDTNSPPANSIYLSQASVDNNTITLSVNAKDLSNVYGIWFNLNFDGSIFQFTGAAEGNFLNQDGPAFFFTTGKSATVVVGLSRQGVAPGVSGSGTICTLTFRGVKGGNSRFDFALNSVADPAGNIIDGVNWYGGTGTAVD